MHVRLTLLGQNIEYDASGHKPKCPGDEGGRSKPRRAIESQTGIPRRTLTDLAVTTGKDRCLGTVDTGYPPSLVPSRKRKVLSKHLPNALEQGIMGGTREVVGEDLGRIPLATCSAHSDHRYRAITTSFDEQALVNGLVDGVDHTVKVRVE